MLAVSVVACILIDYYFKGDRIVLSNFKTAAGVFEQDKYLALIQGAVNLIISIALVQRVGLVGVYVGTIVSGLIANITKPFIIYKVCFDKKAGGYFADSVKYLTVLAVILGILVGLKGIIMRTVTIGSFVVMFATCCVVFNALFLGVFCRTEEFRYIWDIIRKKVKRGGS